jgi:Zn-dependent metalloprotease
LGTSEGWDTKKAFDVMVQANSHYWTSRVSFVEAACGVISAAEDHGFDVATVLAAMAGVGIDTSSCASSTPSTPA